MGLPSKIWDSGWGAIFLLFYSLAAVHLLFPRNLIFKSVGLAPAIIVMFLADSYSNHLINFWAGGELRRATDYVDTITGDDHFYHAASEDIRTTVDDFDRRAYQNNISILTGIIILLTAPFLGFYLHDLLGAAIGALTGLLAVQLLSRRSITQLNTLARDIAEPYKAQYENQ